MRICSAKRLAVLATGLVLLVAPVRAQKIMGTVEMESWTGFTANLSAFCQTAGLPFALTGLNGLTREVFKSTDLTGIDLNRPIRLYLLQAAAVSNAPVQPPQAVLALPVVGDGHSYLDRLGAGYAKTGHVGAVTFFSAPLDRRNGSRKLAAQAVQDVMLLGDATNAVAAAAAVLQADGAPVLPKVVGDVRLGLDMAALLPLAEQGFVQMRRNMDRMPQTPAPGVGTNITGVLNAEMDYALAAMRQIQTVAIGFKTSGKDGTIYLRLDVRPDTTLAASLACLKPASARYTSLLPSNTLFGVVGGGMDAFRVLAKPYGNFVQRIYQSMPGLDSAANPLREMMIKCADLYAGDYAFGLLPDARTNGFLVAEMFAISDPVRARTVMREGVALTSKLDLQTPLGMKIDVLPGRTYAGAEVNAYRYRFTTPTNNAMALPPPAAMVIGSFTGLLASCTLETAFLDHDMIVAFGRAGAIDQVIDRVRSGGDTPFYQQARAVFGEVQTPPAEISHLALVETLVQLAKLSPDLTATQRATLPAPGDGIGSLEFRQGNTYVGAWRITATELRALVQLAPLAQGLFMKANMRQGPAGPAGHEQDDDQPAPLMTPAPGGARPPAPGKTTF